MSNLDDLYALERDAERPAGPQWFPALELADPYVPECILFSGGVVWRVATLAPESYARVFRQLNQHFIVSDDSADLHRYMLAERRRSEVD